MTTSKTVRLTKDGPQLHISPTASPIRDASGNVVGASHPVGPRCNSNAGSDWCTVHNICPSLL
jgi:hypothetical protein